MRELKFRAWNGTQFTYFGWLHEGGASGISFAGPATGGGFGLKDAHNATEQYTGLKDGQGHEIYEGDVVEDYMSDAPPVVVSLDPEGHFIFDQFEYKGFMELVARGRIQIIGNIHENPELIPK